VAEGAAGGGGGYDPATLLAQDWPAADAALGAEVSETAPATLPPAAAVAVAALGATFPAGAAPAVPPPTCTAPEVPVPAAPTLAASPPVVAAGAEIILAVTGAAAPVPTAESHCQAKSGSSCKAGPAAPTGTEATRILLSRDPLPSTRSHSDRGCLSGQKAVRKNSPHLNRLPS
jgi:hypothetical protein